VCNRLHRATQRLRRVFYMLFIFLSRKHTDKQVSSRDFAFNVCRQIKSNAFNLLSALMGSCRYVEKKHYLCYFCRVFA
jgi:hypothetical protein